MRFQNIYSVFKRIHYSIYIIIHLKYSIEIVQLNWVQMNTPCPIEMSILDECRER